MNKKLMFALWFGLCVCASAAFQYEVIKGPQGNWNDGGPNNGVYGNSFTVKVTEGSGSIYILDKINNLYSMSGNGELLSLRANMTPGNYGYVTQDGTAVAGDGTTITTYEEQKSQWNDVVTQTGYKIGDFSVGDEVGIWVTNLNDKTGASILDKSNPINSAEMNYRQAFVGTDALGNDLFELTFTDDGAIFFGVYGVESGKPLPGVLVTLLLGSAALGAMGMKKRSVAQA